MQKWPKLAIFHDPTDQTGHGDHFWIYESGLNCENCEYLSCFWAARPLIRVISN